MTIWKFGPFTPGMQKTVTMPRDAVIRHVAWFNGLWLWAETDPDRASDVERTFGVVGTGHDIPNGWSYVGTAFEDPFVWHLFEETA